MTTTADAMDAAGTCAAVTLGNLPGPDGQTSLREAVCAANSNPGPDTISFAVSGDFALTGAANDDNGGSGDLDVKDSLAINGNGPTNTIIDGSGIERIFDVFPAAAVTFDLSGLTVQNGDTRSTSFKEGGAIYLHNNVTATISGSRIVNNFSGANGAIESRGALTINNSEISNNQTIPSSGSVVGGGIRNGGALTINDTTISNNSVRGEGGGIFIAVATGVTVNINRSTISGNSARVIGGGNGNGGGIATTGNKGTIILTNSTISGNRADVNGGGAYFVTPAGQPGNAALTNVTVTNNTADNDNNGSGAGGGFAQNSATVTLHNTIVAGNFNSTAATRDDVNGALAAVGAYNLIGDGTGSSGIADGVNNNQVGSGAGAINPLLGPLAANGGATSTHALLAGSPAINSADNAACPATDQRGVARPAGSTCDRGAFELVDTTPPDTTITGSPPNPTNSTTAALTFTGSDNFTPVGSLTFECALDGGGFVACADPQSYTGLADGSHTFQVRAVDQFGNVDSSPAGFAWDVDTGEPDTAVTVTPPAQSADSAASFEFTGSDGSGSGVAGFECELDGGGFAACAAPQSYTGLADGSHAFQVRAVDAAGNVDSSPGGFAWDVDTGEPDTAVTVTPPAQSADSAASFEFTGSDGSGSGVAGFECALDGGGFAACAAPQNYTGLADGSHAFQVRAIDAAGNVDSSPAGFAWDVDTALPDVTINQAADQADPTTAGLTTAGPIRFTAVFSEPVTGFGDGAGDVTLSGGAGATTVVVSEISPNDGTTYEVAVSGMTADGTVIAAVPAAAANDAAGNPNTASTSTDNTVAFVAVVELSLFLPLVAR